MGHLVRVYDMWFIFTNIRGLVAKMIWFQINFVEQYLKEFTKENGQSKN